VLGVTPQTLLLLLLLLLIQGKRRQKSGYHQCEESMEAVGLALALVATIDLCLK